MGTPRRKDLTGKRFGKITALFIVGKKYSSMLWRCRCDCGKEYNITAGELKRRKSCKSCASKAYFKPDTVIKSANWLYSRRAKKKKLCFELTIPDMRKLMKSDCIYCGDAPQDRAYSNTQRSSKVNGIDRVDNSKGYTLANCVPCCKSCNFMKNTMTVQTMLRKMRQIIERSESGKLEDMEDK